MSNNPENPENPEREPDGRFKKGNTIGRYKGLSKHTQLLRQETRAGVVKAAHALLLPVDQFISRRKEDLSTLDAVLIKAVTGEGDPKFIPYVLDQAIGKAITPVIAKTEEEAKPKTIIRRTDGSVIEYTLDKKEEE